MTNQADMEIGVLAEQNLKYDKGSSFELANGVTSQFISPRVHFPLEIRVVMAVQWAQKNRDKELAHTHIQTPLTGATKSL